MIIFLNYMCAFTKERDTVTIRLQRKLRMEVDRLAKEKNVSRNVMCADLITIGIAETKDMNPIENALKECRGWFDELLIDKLAKRLKKEKLTFYHKAYLAYKIPIEQRAELFKKLGLEDEHEEAYTIDTVLDKAKTRDNKGEAGYSLYLIANNLTFKLSDFGQEYLSWYVGDDGIEKIRELKPEIVPVPDVQVEFDTEKEIEDDTEKEAEEEEILEPEET